MKSVAIVGLGARGLHTYAPYTDLYPGRMKIVAVADVIPERVKIASEKYGVAEDMCFSSADEFFAKGRLADVVFITTQDRQHVDHALKALDLGYDILLEKPISPTITECYKLKNKVDETGKLVIVCHVLRYTTFFKTVKKVIDDGVIGKVVSIQAIENVGYWHQAHSFVRGNWRNSNIESPMILQKCCHDFDIYGWLIGKKCLGISSFGSLSYFNKENAPEGATAYCMDCPHVDDCVYSAKKIYVESPLNGYDSGNRDWPVNVIMENPTREGVIEALKTGPYGRCVFACDNNVVDHQVCNVLFEEGVTLNFTMCAFTKDMSRYLKVMGTKGEIIADQSSNIVTVTPFGKESVVYDINQMAEDLSGHGGGDNAMLSEFFASLNGEGMDPSSTIANSVQSHEIAMASEKSRLAGGAYVSLDDFRKENGLK